MVVKFSNMSGISIEEPLARIKVKIGSWRIEQTTGLPCEIEGDASSAVQGA